MRCPICKNDLHAHDDSCPFKYQEVPRAENRHLECPLCRAHAVGVNKSDLYECRDCHEQFTTGAWYEAADKNRYFLDDSRLSDLVEVIHMDQKGAGDFPIDKKLAEVDEEIARRMAEIQEGEK